ncbi:MAG: hypothetical protein GX767_06640 [Firmicutes bacterium]|nr:hypothetical protein [Bacillota bacterium]
MADNTAVKTIQTRLSIHLEPHKEAISGNLCRCTGYKKIIEAISRACAMCADAYLPTAHHDSGG